MDTNFDEEDIALLSALNKEIDELTDKEILLRYKTSQDVNTKEIRVKKEKEFFDNIKVQLEKFVTQCIPFGEQLKVDDMQIYEKLKAGALDEETLKKKLSDYTALKELKKATMAILTGEELKKLTEIGKKHFNDGHFDKAHLYFLFLSAMDASNADIWLCKGMAEQNLQSYTEALQSYFTAITLDPTLLLTYLQIIDCLILNKSIEEAKQFYSVFQNEISPHEYSDDPFYISKVEAIKQHLTK
ncbi:MAG: hypothetical protein V4489_06200 [Chlamydiota bacterium]